MADINTIIFDLGGVLIDWNPGYVFDENYFESKEQREFFSIMFVLLTGMRTRMQVIR